MPPGLVDDLIAEILLRLPPDDIACLLRASLVCKRWRRILADPAFRRRHRELYPAPSVIGFVQVVRDQVPYFSRFVPINPASGGPTGRDLPGWLALDCRHGRALFVTPATGPHIDDGEEEEGATLDFVVWDPLTDERRRLPRPSPPPYRPPQGLLQSCSALRRRIGKLRPPWLPRRTLPCSLRLHHLGSHHWIRHICFHVLIGDRRLEPSSVQRHDVRAGPCSCRCAPVLVADTNTLYFRGFERCTFEYKLDVQQRLSVVDPPPKPRRLYMTSVDGKKLGFFSVEKEPASLSLCLWKQGTGTNGVAVWVRGRVIKLDVLLPTDLLIPYIIGLAEGTDVVLLAVPTLRFDFNIYMAELNSGRAKKINEGLSTMYPYTSFSIPVIDSGSTGEGPEQGVSSV